jgi:hypothetical protein
MRFSFVIITLGVLFSACTPKSDVALCKVTTIKEPTNLKNTQKWSPLGEEK